MRTHPKDIAKTYENKELRTYGDVNIQLVDASDGHRQTLPYARLYYHFEFVHNCPGELNPAAGRRHARRPAV